MMNRRKPNASPPLPAGVGEKKENQNGRFRTLNKILQPERDSNEKKIYIIHLGASALPSLKVIGMLRAGSYELMVI